jgi:uncharacterized coiled-coil protein SlyX
MTDDLVKRLRQFERWDPDQKEAADRIEELEKRGLVLEDYIRGLLTVVDSLEEVLEHFRGRIREMEGTK